MTTLLVASFTLAVNLGCNGDTPPVKGVAKLTEVKQVKAGRNVTVEFEGKIPRRVLVEAEVCLREGQLEQLLCRRQTKEHEAILTADVDGRDIHKALLAAGAKPGKPVKYDPVYEPATGDRIKVSVRYEDKGKQVTIPAQDWIQSMKTKKPMAIDWVFAGSRFVPDPFDPKRPDYYLANDGDLICVSNFPSALLDLPVNSPKDNADLAFVAFTERIPPEKTKVIVILEPVPEERKK